MGARMGRLRLAVVGVGHLGKEHARILAELPDVELVGVVDTNPSQARTIAERCRTQAFEDYRPLLGAVDAAVIVVPTMHHHAVAGDFLRHGVPLLVEKPLAATLPQAEELVALATRQGVLLQVGHIERFNPAFEELQRRSRQPKYARCERYGPFSGRSTDIGVVLDLMIHDLDLLLTLVRAPVRTVEALGVSVLGGHEDVANARITFSNGCVADVSACRVSPTPLRRMQVWSPEGFAGIDFAKKHLTLIQPSETLRGPQHNVKEELFTKHLQKLELDCDAGDQLTRELDEFIFCVRAGAQPRADGVAGRNAVALAEQVLKSIRNHSWDGKDGGVMGPDKLPTSLGRLFRPVDQQAA
jgi:predicted dehydrogenase